MSSFLNQTFGQASIGQIGQTFTNSTIGQTLSNTTSVELKVGAYSIYVREKIAEGGFGVVHLATDAATKRDLVLKKCNIDRPESFEIVQREIKFLQRLEGPHVVQLLDRDILQKGASREALLLMENYPGGHLLDRLLKREGAFLPLDSVYRIFGELLLGVKSMHDCRPPVVHRDLKLENILFDQQGKVRLCDFGSCVEGYVSVRDNTERDKAAERIDKETTQMYRAPEMVDLYMRSQLTEKTDIWALGCILFSLVFLTHPFQDAGSLGILAGKVVFPKTNIEVSEDLKSLILRMLDVDPEARPDVDHLLQCIIELSSHRPLPAFTLSPQAQQKREERLAANVVRERKSRAHKSTLPAPLKKALPPKQDSVAARRLAAKRGQPITPPSPALSAPTLSTVATVSQPQHETFNPNPAEDFGGTGDTFDPFSVGGGVPAATTDTFDPFAEDPPEESFDFNPSFTHPPPASTDPFNPTNSEFEETPTPATQQTKSDGFDTSESVGADAFGFSGFDDALPAATPTSDPFGATTVITAGEKDPFNPASVSVGVVGDGFGAAPPDSLGFSAFDHDAPAATGFDNNNNGFDNISGFDAFDQSENTFDPFSESNTGQADPNTSFSAFDSPHTHTAPAKNPKPKTAAASLFGAVEEESTLGEDVFVLPAPSQDTQDTRSVPETPTQLTMTPPHASNSVFSFDPAPEEMPFSPSGRIGEITSTTQTNTNIHIHDDLLGFDSHTQPTHNETNQQVASDPFGNSVLQPTRPTSKNPQELLSLFDAPPPPPATNNIMMTHHPMMTQQPPMMGGPPLHQPHMGMGYPAHAQQQMGNMNSMGRPMYGQQMGHVGQGGLGQYPLGGPSFIGTHPPAPDPFDSINVLPQNRR